MAKGFLVRWGSEADFRAVKLALREIGFAVDTEKMFIGGAEDYYHIPNEIFVRNMITDGVAKYKPVAGETAELVAAHKKGAFAFNTTLQRILYKKEDESVLKVVTDQDMPIKTASTVVVAAANIDANDNNSVSISGYNRPIELIFLNGVLCTTNASDPHQYVVDPATHILKIKECAENDIIAYF